MHVDNVPKMCYNNQLTGKYEASEQMKEYEYIVEATNEVFSHMISSVICLENYMRTDRPRGAFKHIFRMFNEFREDYKDNVKLDDIENDDLQEAKLKAKCRIKREEIISRYIKDLERIDGTIDYKKKASEFYDRLENEDVETLEMQLMIYPYLLSEIRKKEELEKEIKDGKKDN